MDRLRDDHQFVCCNCCHVKYGTIVLGSVELVVTVFLLLGTAKLIIDKGDLPPCTDELVCDSSSLTLAGDYISTLLLCLWILAVGCLFGGVVFGRCELLMPHLLLQAVTLIFSLVYFFLYAWQYFYVQLHKNGLKFEWSSALERLWLVLIYLIIATFEIYAFCVVISCFRYLRAKQRTEQLILQQTIAKRERLYTV